MCRLRVLEVDTEPALAEQDPHHEVDEQTRESGAHRKAYRQDRDERDDSADQQDGVHLMRVEGHVSLGVVRGQRDLILVAAAAQLDVGYEGRRPSSSGMYEDGRVSRRAEPARDNRGLWRRAAP